MKLDLLMSSFTYNRYPNSRDKRIKEKSWLATQWFAPFTLIRHISAIEYIGVYFDGEKESRCSFFSNTVDDWEIWEESKVPQKRYGWEITYSNGSFDRIWTEKEDAPRHCPLLSNGRHFGITILEVNRKKEWDYE